MGDTTNLHPAKSASPNQQHRDIRRSMELEHSLLKGPYEVLAKELRFSQKLLDKELHNASQTVTELALKGGSLPSNKIYSSLDGLVLRLKGLKRKLEESKQKEEEQVRRSKSRLQHLNYPNNNPSISSMSISQSVGGSPWQTGYRLQRLDRLLVDYLLRNGFHLSAVEIVRENGLDDLFDLSIYQRGRIAIEGLERKDCTEALKWCFENRYRLRKQKSSLELNLRLQEFVELVRQDKLKEAIIYSRKHFSIASGNNVSRIQRAMGALAFRRNTECPQYKWLFEEERWEDLVNEFKCDLGEVHSLPVEPALILLLGCGMSSLKTFQCYETEFTGGTSSKVNIRLSSLARSGLKYPGRLRRSDSSDSSSDVTDSDSPSPSSPSPSSSTSSSSTCPSSNLHGPSRRCPICNPNFRELARILPYSHHVNSSLICSITGKPMDEDNYPYVLPNGQVFSKAAVEEILAKNDGKLLCPKTGVVFKLPQLKKAFIS